MSSSEGGAATSLDAAHHNARAIVGTLLEQGPMPRMQIAQLTGISPAAVTRLTARLITTGLLRELPSVLGPADAGRPRVPIDLAEDSRLAVGIHIGLLRTEIGLVGLRSRVLARLVLEHGSTRPEDVAEQAAEGVNALLAEHAGGRQVLGVGATIGGRVDTASGVVVEHASLGWQDVPFAAILAERLPHRLLFENAVRGLAMAETRFGAAVGTRSMATLFVGNIVGAALVFDGEVHYGPGSAAGWLTHLPLHGVRGVPCTCGRRGCAQSVISDAAVLEMARARHTVGAEARLEDLVRVAHDGDKDAVQLLRERSRTVGQVAALLLDVVNPEVIALSGGPLATPEYIPTLQREMARWSSHGTAAGARLTPSTLGEHSLITASATVFLHDYFANPLAFEEGAPAG
ncbi:MAG: ROK family transcriptional regulator [Catenulispora sp.]|nr:ROK family transcriptional regulator [Catenulispora sp.]